MKPSDKLNKICNSVEISVQLVHEEQDQLGNSTAWTMSTSVHMREQNDLEIENSVAMTSMVTNSVPSAGEIPYQCLQETPRTLTVIPAGTSQ